jgi:hypothetical protein
VDPHVRPVRVPVDPEEVREPVDQPQAVVLVPRAWMPAPDEDVADPTAVLQLHPDLALGDPRQEHPGAAGVDDRVDRELLHDAAKVRDPLRCHPGLLGDLVDR